MQTDGEEQQDNADLGELVGQRLIGDEARREGTDQDAGEQIADQRRDAQPVRARPKPNARTRPEAIVAMSGVSCTGTVRSISFEVATGPACRLTG